MMNNAQNNISNIERTVMARVHRIMLLRMLISPAALSLVVFTAALWGIGRAVWVARIFENAPQDFAAAVRFYLAAFEGTEFMVQALTLLALASLAYIARAAARSLGGALTPATN